MKPERDSSLVDLVDRLLNKGLVLNADLIISVAGIPMIGLSLKAALASMETMLEYGMMEDWDKATREWYARQKSAIPLSDGEDVLFKSFGYIWHSEGLISNWVPGIWHVTNERLFLWRRESAEMIFEASINDINASNVEIQKGSTELRLRYKGGVARIGISEAERFRDAVERATANNLFSISA